MRAVLRSIAYHLPERVLDNAELAEKFPEWSIEKIRDKTGIDRRHIAAEGETSGDLAERAARALFDREQIDPSTIDYLLFCTQSPDHFLPTTACVLQTRLGLRTDVGALDFNLGCSGYVYGLGLAKALIETGQARSVLLLTGETYSKFINPGDKRVRTLFGDAGAATLITVDEQTSEAAPDPIGPFVYGTDGRGAQNLIVRTGAFREARTAESAREVRDEFGNTRSADHLYMNGGEIFTFTLKAVPQVVDALLSRARTTLAQVDLVVLHQANAYMLEHLRKRLGVPRERFVVELDDVGNTVSCTIPIALERVRSKGLLAPGMRVLLVGFGVGYSWSATLITWAGAQR